MNMRFRVINVFKLRPGTAGQEIERSRDAGSILNRLKSEPGFVSYEVVKLNDDSILTIQAWDSKVSFGRAIAKVNAAHESHLGDRESLAISREGFFGEIILTG